jgi:hypothetical protein
MDFIFDDDVDEVGSEVEAFCPKCKADTAHVIMSKYEDEIRRVQCNPCGDVHAFRKPRGEENEEVPEPTSTKKRAAKAKPTWEQVTAKSKKEPKLYIVADRYGDNDLISHPKFGIGFVSDVIGLDKIEVTFQAERRVLVHNRKGMSLPPAAYAHAVDATLPAKGRKGAKQAAAAVKKGAAKEAKEAKKAPVAAKKPVVAKPVKQARPVAKAKVKAKVAASRPTKAKPKSRAAAPVRAKPAARKPVRTAAGKKVKKR